MASYAWKPRSRFLDSSMRSTRAITCRSPTTSSSARTASLHASPGRDAPDVVGVGGQGGHEGQTGVDRPRLGRQPEGLLPARTVEPDGGMGGHGLDQLGADRVGQDVDHLGCTEGRVTEVNGDEVGPALGQSSADHRQVQILDQHDGVGLGQVGDDRGERVVDPPVGGPRLGEVLVEAGEPGQIPQVVVEIPERGVAHDVVGHRVISGVQVDQPDRWSLLRLDQAGAHRLAVLVAECGGDPDGTGAFDDRAEARRPARRRLGERRASRRRRGETRADHDWRRSVPGVRSRHERSGGAGWSCEGPGRSRQVPRLRNCDRGGGGDRGRGRNSRARRPGSYRWPTAARAPSRCWVAPTGSRP